jgi:DNA replication protein DnaD
MYLWLWKDLGIDTTESVREMEEKLDQTKQKQQEKPRKGCHHTAQHGRSDAV